MSVPPPHRDASAPSRPPPPRSAAPALADLEPELPGRAAGLRPGAALDDHPPQVLGRHDRVAVAGPAPRRPSRPELDHPAAVVAPVHEDVFRPGAPSRPRSLTVYVVIARPSFARRPSPARPRARADRRWRSGPGPNRPAGTAGTSGSRPAA